MVDVRTARRHGVHQRQHLAPGKRPADPARQVDHLVDQALEAEADHQRGHEHQTGVGHQIGLVEGHLDAVDSARYCRHRKCLLCVGQMRLRTSPFSQAGRHFPRMRGYLLRSFIGGSRLSESCAESRVVISWLDEVASPAWDESHDVARSGLGYLHVHGASVEDEPQTAHLFRPDITLLDVDRNRLTESPVSRLREKTDDDGSDNLFAYDDPPSATNWAELRPRALRSSQTRSRDGISVTRSASLLTCVPLTRRPAARVADPLLIRPVGRHPRGSPATSPL